MDVKIRFSIKACCLFEQLSGKSFFKCNEADDIMCLLYAMYVTTNDSNITYKVFCSMLENRKVAKALMGEYNGICRYLEQLKLNEQFDSYNKESMGKDAEEMTITRLASSLIIQHHLDAGYVMDKMQLWEIVPYFQVADNMRKMDLIDKRFWTYLTILPHVDGKKLKSPDKLFKFDWENGSKKDAEKDLADKSEYIKQFFAAQREAAEKRKEMEEKKDEQRRPDGDDES